MTPRPRAGRWIGEDEASPEDGEIVEILTFPSDPEGEVRRARKLGDQWWIRPDRGLCFLMGEPSAPYVWRHVSGRTIERDQRRAG